MESYPFEKYLNKDYLKDTLVRLLKIDCSVALGPETLMEPDDPKLVTYVQEVLRPELRRIGIPTVFNIPKNQFVVKLGSGETDSSLLIMAYTPVQHYNLMKDPFSGKIETPTAKGIHEPCAFGQGATQNKSHFSAMLTLLKAFVDSDVQLNGTLYFAANNEGRSSHECAWSIIRNIEPKPRSGLILVGAGNRISVANRGRVDIIIHVNGKATHSSRPEDGLNAIDGAVEALNRIKRLKFTKTHPKLGGQHAVPYQLTFDPMAPHTLPESARIKIDRRLLPGDDVDQAVDEIRDAVGDLAPYTVQVERDVAMLPAEVDPSAPIVKGLQKAISSIDGKDAELIYGKGSYDAGGPVSKGIPTVMWGRADHNPDLLGDDFVTIRGVEEEARIVGRLVMDMLG